MSDQRVDTALPLALPLARPAESFQLLWRHTGGHRAFVWLVGIAGLLAAVAGLVAPWMIGWLVDVLLAAGDSGTSGTGTSISTSTSTSTSTGTSDVDPAAAVWWAAAAVAGAGLIAAACSWAGQAWLARAAEPTVAGLREAVMDRALRIGAAGRRRDGGPGLPGG
ncbi:hypothetical protein [Citricoccus sp.]|uniref:hypothetical protein n=1 Tax=Citricoccus sp. TaxID=1978372 RepID=UPI0028BD63E0|nr:hypothetical protein [Citricoccus sp.]